MSVAFDTLKFARALQTKGRLTAEQAEGVAEAFAEATGEQLATKSDLRAEASSLRSETAKLGAELRAEMAKLGADLRAEMAKLGADLRAEMTKMGAEILTMKGEQALLKWMLGFNLAMTVAVLFLLLRH